MSDQQQESVEEEEEDEENEEEQQDEDEDNDQEDDEQQQQNDEDEQNEQDEQEEEQEEKQENDNEDTQNNVKLPKFRSIEEPEQFKFSNLIAEISSLSVSVDHFIHTLPSHGGSVYRSYIPPPPVYIPPVSRFPIEQKQQIPQKVVIMKDQDIQVSMQPQIIIQPTKIEKEIEKQSYKISNQSTKFLAQLYEQNKKLKRWQNSSHQMNTNAFSEGRMNSGNGFYNSREKYERKEYEKGLFNVQERNREIDEAISKLRNSQE